MSIIESIVLGLVQGITEFIPVSSSGHLLLTHEIFGSSDNSLAFDVALHVGTLAALVVYFRKDILELIKNIGSKNKAGRLARLLVSATVPAVVVGLLFSDYIDDNLRTPTVVAITLAVVGVLMLIADAKTTKKEEKEVTKKQGMMVGVSQAIALIPGVSRSGITITTGIFSGMTRARSAKFSFLLAIPIIAGSALGILLKDGGGYTDGNWQIVLGIVTAFVSGILAIKILLGVITKMGLRPFAVYRIVLAVIVIAIFR